MAVPIIETNNVIRHPEGGCPLQVGEGMDQRLQMIRNQTLTIRQEHMSSSMIYT